MRKSLRRRSAVTMVLAILATLVLHGAGEAQMKTELVEPRLIWDQYFHNAPTDLVRFKDRWYSVTREETKEPPTESAIRVSFGWESQPSDFDATADAWLQAARRTVLKNA